MSVFIKASGESQHMDVYNRKKQHLDNRNIKSLQKEPKYKIDTLTQHQDFGVLQAFENFFQGMPDAIVIASLSGVIVSLNAQAERLLLCRNSEASGQSVIPFFTEDFAKAIAAGAACAERQIFAPYVWRALTETPSFVLRRADGEIVCVEVHRCDALLDGLPRHVYKISDHSGTARMEKLIAERDREIAVLSRLSILGELTAAITHELSQPLTAIASYTAAARNSYSAHGEDSAGHGLQLICRAGEQAQRAWQIVQRLRTLLQHTGSDHRPCDLRATVKDAIELATLGVAIGEVRIETDLPVRPLTVSMDPVQIQILLANLIRNAVDELRMRQGPKEIRISLSTTPDGMAQVSVADNGPGIAPNVHDSIFDPFLTTKPEGLGVGLAVSRRIALAHKGRLAARNLDSGGAEFSFIVPVGVNK